jgi:probable F420-dependent oxidoreductase
MQIGIKLPTRELGGDGSVIREWAQAAERLGFDHIVAIDHVLGADPDANPDWAALFPAESRRPPYVVGDHFDEPLVTLAFIAAATRSIGLVTGILVLPQRQTALVAKQAAQLDVLSDGRVRICAAVGWNPVEYAALGMDFHTRGRRFEEQLTLLRRLWTEEVVDFTGAYDTVVGAGITPLPLNRPIPLWVGGFSELVMRRVGRLADGWHFGGDPRAGLEANIQTMRQAASAAGRDPASLGIEGGVELRNGFDVSARVREWSERGATHVTIDPQGCGRSGTEHVALLAEIAGLLGR